MTTRKITVRIAAGQETPFGQFLRHVFHGSTGKSRATQAVVCFADFFDMMEGSDLRAYEGGQHLATVKATREDFRAWVQLVEETMGFIFPEFQELFESEDFNKPGKTVFRLTFNTNNG